MIVRFGVAAILVAFVAIGCGDRQEGPVSVPVLEGWIPGFDTMHYNFINDYLADTSTADPDSFAAYVLVNPSGRPVFWRTPSGRQCLLLFSDLTRARLYVSAAGFDSVTASGVSERIWEQTYPSLMKLGLEIVAFNQCLGCQVTPTIEAELMAGNIARLARASIAEERYTRDWFFGTAGRCAANGAHDSVRWAGRHVSSLAPGGLEGLLIILVDHALSGNDALATAMADSFAVSQAAPILVEMIESLDERPEIWERIVEQARQ